MQCRENRAHPQAVRAGSSCQTSPAYLYERGKLVLSICLVAEALDDLRDVSAGARELRLCRRAREEARQTCVLAGTHAQMLSICW